MAYDVLSSYIGLDILVSKQVESVEMNLPVASVDPRDRGNKLARGAIALFDAYWYSQPKRQGLPLLKDFRAERIRAIMPSLMVKDVLREPLDFRFRFVGPAIREEFGKDFAGLKFTEIDGYDSDGHVWENNEFVVDERVVSSMHIPYAGPSHDFLYACQSSYPFSEDGAGVDHIVTVIEFHPRKPGFN